MKLAAALLAACAIAAPLAAQSPPDSAGPRHYQVLTAPAESIHVVAAGAGQPLVLVPGLFGSVYGFRKIVPPLVAAGYRVIVVEPLGIGTSARPQGADYSLAAQADRVAAAIDSVAGGGPVLLIGHSIGGAIALRVAYRHPQQVRGVLTIEGGPTERAATPAMGRAMRLAPLITKIGGMHLVRGQLKRALRGASGDDSWITEEVIRGYTVGAAANLGATLRAYRAMAQSTEPEPLAPHLRDIRCPVRLLVGDAEHDGGVPPEEITELHAAVRTFAVDHAAGAGHYIFEEAPEAVLRSIAALRAETTASR